QTAVTGEPVSSRDINISRSIAAVLERHEGDSSQGTVIHIQDNHTSYSAQKYLSKIIKQLNESYGISLIGTEGASSVVNTSEFSRFPDKEVKENVADYFLKKGDIDGVEFFCIVEESGSADKIYVVEGVEVDILYKRNLDAFLRSLSYQKELTVFCEEYRAAIARLKPLVYSEQLGRFDAFVESYKCRDISFIDFAEGILELCNQNLIEIESFGQIDNLVKLISYEKSIDFSRVDPERMNALREAGALLPPEEAAKLLKEELAFRTQKLPTEQYYSSLDTFFNTHEFSLDGYPNLKSYIAYVRDYYTVNNSKVFEESQRIVDVLYETLIRSEREKTLYGFSRLIDLMNQFAGLKMTRTDFELYHSYRSVYSTAFISDTLVSLSKEYAIDFEPAQNLAVIEENVAHFEEFYSVAHEREDALVANTLGLMKKYNQQSIILLAGGFHTEGITEKLRERNLSYVVVQPQMNAQENLIPYTELLQNASTPLDQMLALKASTLKLASWMTENVPLAHAERAQSLGTKMKLLFSAVFLQKEWRALAAQYSIEEQSSLARTLEKQLAASLQTVIRLAGYESDITINAVTMDVGRGTISAHFSIQGISDSIEVSFTDSTEFETIPDIIAENVLEIIRLGDGSMAYVVNANGGNALSEHYAVVRKQILDIVSAAPQTAEQILAQLHALPGFEKSTISEIESYLSDFRALGIIELSGSGLFSLATDETAQSVAAVVRNSLAPLSEGSGILSRSYRTTRISTGIFPQAFRSALESSNIGTLIIEPSVSIIIIKKMVDAVVSGSLQGVLKPGAIVQLDETAHIMITQPVDGEHSILTVVLKPATDVGGEQPAETKDNIELIALQLLKDEIARKNGLDDISLLNLSTNLSVGEKTVLLDYLLTRARIEKNKENRLENMLRSILGFPEDGQPVYTDRAAQLILGTSYRDIRDTALAALLRINPALSITNELSEAINHSIVELSLLRSDAGMTVNDTMWFSLIEKSFSEAPATVQNSLFHRTVGAILRKANQGERITAAELNQVVANQIALQEPATLSEQARNGLLNTLRINNTPAQFVSRDRSITVTLAVADRQSDDNTFSAYETATRQAYHISVLPLNDQGGIVYPENIEDSENSFVDPAGYVITRMDTVIDRIDTSSQPELAYQSLRASWNDFLNENDSAGQITFAWPDITVVGETIVPILDGYLEHLDSRRQAYRERQQLLSDELEGNASAVAQFTAEIEEVRGQIKYNAGVFVNAMEQIENEQNQAQRSIKEYDVRISELVEEYVAMELLAVMSAELTAQPDFTGIANTLAVWTGVNSENASGLVKTLSDNPDKVRSLNLPLMFTAETIRTIKENLPADVSSEILSSIFVQRQNGAWLTPRFQEKFFDRIAKRNNQAVFANILSSAVAIKEWESRLESTDNRTAAEQQITRRWQAIENLTKRSQVREDIIQTVLLLAEIQKSLRTASKDRVLSTAFDERRRKAHNDFVTARDQLQERLGTVQRNLATAQDQLTQRSEQVLPKINDISAELLFLDAVQQAIEGDPQALPASLFTGIKTRARNNDAQLLAQITSPYSAQIDTGRLQTAIFELAYKITLHNAYAPVTAEQQPAAQDILDAASKKAQLYLNNYKAKYALRGEEQEISRNIPVFQNDSGAITPGILVYGTDSAGQFTAAQNQVHNYRVNGLITQALNLLDTVDSQLAAIVRNNFNIVVAANVFLPYREDPRGLYAQSLETKTLYLEKAQFGYAMELQDTHPRAAVRLIAAHIAFAAQPLRKESVTPVKINTVSYDDLAALITAKALQTQLPVSPEAIAAAARSIISLRDARTEPLRSVNDFNGLSGVAEGYDISALMPHILPYFSFSDTVNIYTVAVNKADMLLNSRYLSVRRMLQLEQERYFQGINPDDIPPFLSGTLFESLNKVLDADIPVYQKYSIILNRLTGSEQLLDELSLLIQTFDHSSGIQAFIALAREMQEVLDNYKTRITVSIKNAQRIVTPSGEVVYSVLLLDGKQRVMKAAEFKFFSDRIQYSLASMNMYVDEMQGIGIQFGTDKEELMRMPVLVPTVQYRQIPVEQLSRLRRKDSEHGAINSPLATNLITVFDPVQAGNRREASVFLTVKQRADILKNRYRDIQKLLEHDPVLPWNSLSFGEHKGIAALMLMQEGIDNQWAGFIADIYDESIPFVMSQRVSTVFNTWLRREPSGALFDAAQQLLAVTGSNGWNELTESSRNGIGSMIMERYTAQLQDARQREYLSILFDRFAPFKEGAPSNVSFKEIEFLWNVIQPRLNAVSSFEVIARDIAWIQERISGRYEILEKTVGDDTLKSWEQSQLQILKENIQQTAVALAVEYVTAFNSRYAGIARLDVSRQIIEENPLMVLEYLALIQEPLQLDAQQNPSAAMVKNVIDAYEQARRLWNNGFQQEALDAFDQLLPRIQDAVAQGDFQFIGENELGVFQNDRIMLSDIISAKRTAVQPIDLFSGMNLLLRELLAQLPENKMFSVLTAFPEFVYANSVPEPGLTEVVLSLKPAGYKLREDEYQSTLEYSMFESYGAVSSGSILYIDTGKQHIGTEEFFSAVQSAVSDAYAHRAKSFEAKLSSLSAAGYPADIRLLRISPQAFRETTEGIRLDNEVRTRDILPQSRDIGMSIPVALPPGRYGQLKQNQLQVFDLIRGYIDQASYAMNRHSDMVTARQFLEHAQQLADGLNLISPVLRNTLRMVIKRDIDELTNAIAALTAPAGTAGEIIYQAQRAVTPFYPKAAPNPVTSRLLDGAFDDLSRSVSRDLTKIIRQHYSIVIGNKPRENAPPNVIYISSSLYDMLIYLVAQEATSSAATALLARAIFDAYTNKPEFMTSVFLDQTVGTPEDLQRYFIPVQIGGNPADALFTGEIISPSEITYNKRGQPIANLSGHRTVTHFKNGRPVTVVEFSPSPQGITLGPLAQLFGFGHPAERSYPLTESGLDFRVSGFTPVRNGQGDIASLNLFSPLEQWIGDIAASDLLYFIEKNGVVVALVKATEEDDRIFPLLPLDEIGTLFGLESEDQAIPTLKSYAVQHRQKIKEMESEELREEPEEGVGAEKSSLAQSTVLLGVLAAIAVGCLAGCGVDPSGSGQNQPQIKQGDQSQQTVEQGQIPDISQFQNQPLDQAITSDQKQTGLQLLENTRTVLQQELDALIKDGQGDLPRADDIRARLLETSKQIETLQALPVSDETAKGDVASLPQDTTNQRVSIEGQAAVNLPDGLRRDIQAILTNQEYETLMRDLASFSTSRLLDRSGPNALANPEFNKFDGFVRSYAGDEKHSDYSYLVQHGRVVPYDQSISIYADLANNNYVSARRKIDALFRIMQYEQDRGLRSVVRFGYNTTDDLYESPISPLGNTAWALKSIFAYIDVTGDWSAMTGSKGELLNNAMEFVLSQQVLNQQDPRYGFFLAGMRIRDEGGRIVEIQNQWVVFEHLADMHDLLNLAFRVTGNPVFKERRILLDNKVLEKFLVDIDDSQGAHFRPNMNQNGQFGSGIAIDDLTWAGSMVLTMDHIPQARRLEITRRLITHVQKNFVVEHQAADLTDPSPAQAVVMNDALIQDRTANPKPNTIIGVKFFDGVFGDDFIEQKNWDDSTIMSVQFEATLGYIHLLVQTASVSDSQQERDALMREARFLLDNILKAQRIYNKYNGIPYSTRNISQVQTTLESTISTETLRTLLGIWSNPRLMWTFIGASDQSLQGNRQVDIPQSLQGLIPPNSIPA
ncbi:hypothetical protein KDK77_04515, partial [bacterium]|nr:hypothetical protein [bacterium]